MGSAFLPNSDAAGAFGTAQPDALDAPWSAERRVRRAFLIPPLVLLTVVLALAVGELACGTGLYFVSMMAVTLCSIGITYNLLGGLSRISGFMFAGMAAQRIVISQFAKVILFEPADRNLLVPNLTIAVYAVFFLSLMVGVFLFARTRLPLPKPLEPTSLSQIRLLYFVSLIAGVIASTVLYIDAFGTSDQTKSVGHGVGLAFSSLLLFSIVLAVDGRIRSTEGRHSLGIWVIVPCAIAEVFAYLQTSRMGEATPIVIYFLSCYVRGYRFRKRHYLTGLICAVLFQTLISPFALYSRPRMREALSFRARLSEGYELLSSPPSWAALQDTQLGAQLGSEKDEYYSAPGTYVLSRLSLIRADSDLIAACSTGFHYGFKPLKLFLQENIPHILYKNKPQEGSSSVYIEGVIGSDVDSPGYWSFTSISDAFGAFGWAGVVVFPFFILPIVFVVYDSMFDMARPWGTVALGMVALAGGVPMGATLTLLIKQPLYLWLMSVLTVGISRLFTGSNRYAGGVRGRRLGDYPRAETIS
ncbi:MAG TPA: hypothetical protein VHU89_06570 [Acidobacteriaceae bacterium]|jgi:hypothetical protein|nr:hypothetical protein [Acidobacteriaceae bacterium]